MRTFRRVLLAAAVICTVVATTGTRIHARFGPQQISGHVQDAGTSAPLQFVSISVVDANGNNVPGVSGFTDASGDYTTSGALADGTYFLRTFNSAQYINQAGGGLQCAFFCNAILSTPVVMSGGVAAPMNFSLAKGGTISGNVKSEALANLTGVPVSIVDAGNQTLASINSDVSGNYTTLEGVPDGTYYIKTNINTSTAAPVQGYINEVYNDVPCLVQACPTTSATPIVIAGASTAPNINFQLHAGARFSGTVKDSGSSTGIANATVQVFNAGGQIVSQGLTNGSGVYTTAIGLQAGSYTLRTVGTGPHINKFNDGTICVGSFCGSTTVTPIAIADGATQSGVDFSLDPGAVFTGTVTEQGTGAPLTSTVQVLSATGAFLTQGQGNFSTGVYTTSDGLPPGSYFLRSSSFDGHIDQLYNGVPCAPSCSVNFGTPFVVGAPMTLSGPNFSLAKGGRVSGSITSTVGGAKLGGVTVAVVTASGITVTTGTTNGNGDYVTNQGLTPGSYFLRTSNQRGFINEVYPNIACNGTSCPNNVGTPVVISGANTVTANMDLAPGGRISGFIKQGGAPVPGAGISVLDASGNTVNTGLVDGLGNYITAAGMTTGSNYLVRTNNQVGDIDQLYNGQPCGVVCNLASGTQVAVTSPNTTPNINFNLVQGGQITGSVASGAMALAGITVQAFNPLNNTTLQATTDSNGVYVLRGLPNATYYARTSNTQGYINEAYDNIPCVSTCGSTTLGTPLVISSLNTIPGINFDLTAGGRISGVVTDFFTASPIPNVPITIVDGAGLTVSTATTDLFGHYLTQAGLGTGTYFARTSNSAGYVNQLWNNVTCPNGCSLVGGAPISVTAGATSSGIDFALRPGGRISGSVIDLTTSAPLQNVSVQVFDAAGRSVSNAVSDASGNYVSGAGLPTGNYFVKTINSAGYVDQLFDNKPCPTSCSVLTGDAVGVTEGSTTGGVDFALAPGGRISGIVKDAATLQPLAGVSITIFDSTGRAVSSGSTNSFGIYTTFSGLATGTYYARTANGLGYINQLYNNITCIANCVPTTGLAIHVTSPATTSNINFNLSSGGRISGTVSAAIGGGALSGVTVQVFDNTGAIVSTGSTNASGQYITTGGLTTGNYFLRTFNNRGLINQLYDGLPCSGTCTVTAGTSVPVTLGSTTPNINFSLADGARFTGQVNRTLPSGPAPNVLVEIWNTATNTRVATGVTDATGAFVTAEGVANGTYRARTQNQSALVNQIFNGVNCSSSCDPSTAGTDIVVAAPGIVGTSVDFTLVPDGDANFNGIANTIDTGGDTFSDIPLGGTTSGVIVDRGGPAAAVSVFDISPGGVQMQLVTAGATPATFDVCPTGGSERVLLDVAGEAGQVSCAAGTGSTTLRAISASPTIELRDPPTGTGLLIHLTTGQAATIGSPVVASPANTDAITVEIIGTGGTSIGSFDLDPGESVDVTVNPDNSVQTQVLVGVVTITVGSNTETVSEGGSHTFTPPGFNYTFTGFFAPISNPPVVNKAKAGSAVPITFGLGGNQGMDIFAPGSPTSQQIGCSNGVPTGSIEGVDTPGKSGLEYDPSTQRYSYTWKTVKSWAGTCRQLTVQLKDGSVHTALFQFK